jgi:hypothetical protein
VESPDTRGRTRRRHEQRLGPLRRRSALAAALGFVAFLGLAAQHAVGSTKRAAKGPVPPSVAVPVRYFDQQADGFAFDDGSAAPPLPPPVAQTNVS